MVAAITMSATKMLSVGPEITREAFCLITTSTRLGSKLNRATRGELRRTIGVRGVLLGREPGANDIYYDMTKKSQVIIDMPPKRYREGSPNTVLRSMSSEESGNSMNNNSSQNTINSGNNQNLIAISRTVGRQDSGETLERAAKRLKTQPPQPPLVTAAQLAGRKQKANYEKLQNKRNSLPRGLYNIFSNVRLQNAVNRGGYQNMNTQINSKLRLANNHEKRIKNQLNKIPNGNFRTNARFKINNVIGNNSKTKALLQQINTEQKKINANAAANKAADKAADKAAANNARRKAVANAKKKAIIARQQVSVKASNKAAAQAANNAKANAKAAANAKAKAATPANSARVSATTLGTPNQSLNNNASSLSIIKPVNRQNSKETAGKLMKEGILLEITKQAQRTTSMKNLKNLKKLNGSLNSPNSIKEYDTYAWALLYDMVKGSYYTKFEGMQITMKTLKQIHEKLRQKNNYSSGRTNWR